MEWKLLILIFLITLVGCGPAAKLRRAEKLIKKAEEAGLTWTTDTVYVYKAVTVPEVRVDSIIVSKPGDTVVISKDRLKLKYVRLAGDTVFIEAACEVDTVTVEVPITITKEIKADCFWKWWHVLLGVLAGVCLWMGVIQVKKAGK